MFVPHVWHVNSFDVALCSRRILSISTLYSALYDNDEDGNGVGDGVGWVGGFSD